MFLGGRRRLGARRNDGVGFTFTLNVSGGMWSPPKIGGFMKRLKNVFSVALLILAAVLSAHAQQVTAVRGGKMFDPKSRTNLTNQLVLITCDKITDVGAADRVQIPAGARVVDHHQRAALP